MEGIANAVDHKNEVLKERNEMRVFGNQAPRHQAGTRANLMAGSKARAARAEAPKQGNHNKLNKEFAKRQAELQMFGVPHEQKAKANFSYKQMRVDLSLMSNGCCV